MSFEIHPDINVYDVNNQKLDIKGDYKNVESVGFMIEKEGMEFEIRLNPIVGYMIEHFNNVIKNRNGKVMFSNFDKNYSYLEIKDEKITFYMSANQNNHTYIKLIFDFQNDIIWKLESVFHIIDILQKYKK